MANDIETKNVQPQTSLKRKLQENNESSGQMGIANIAEPGTAETTTSQQLEHTMGQEKKRRVYAPHAEEHGLSGYNKKKILEYLKEKGCNSNYLEKQFNCFKVRTDEVLEFFNKHIEQAQLHVHEECDSLSFGHISEWLKLFKSWNLSENSYYEHAIVVNAIANNEELPESHVLNGVDLKSIYKFLGNALMGLPQPQLDTRSAQFLAREFELLVDEANTNSGDLETKLIKATLKKCTHERVAQRKCKLSLDPLWLDDIA